MDTHRRRIGALAAVGIAWFLAARPLVADAPPTVGPPPPAPPTFAQQHERDNEALHLTPTQKAAFTTFEGTSHARHQGLMKRIFDLHQQLWSLYQAYKLDVVQAKHLNDQVNAVQKQLLDMHLSDETQMRRILSPAQFAILQSQIRQERQQHQHGTWGGPGPDGWGAHGPGDHPDWGHGPEH
ncbi:MAG: hypothetical protein ACLQVD_03485 [Capsulimonadaceae bacterium]